MGTKPQGMSDEEFAKVEHDRRAALRAKRAEYARKSYHKKRTAEGKAAQGKRNGKLFTMTQEHKDKIQAGVRRAKVQRDARKAALAKKDSKDRKPWTRQPIPVPTVQMAGMINDLERFIANMRVMSAHDYLEAREELIQSIIRRGGK